MAKKIDIRKSGFSKKLVPVVVSPTLIKGKIIIIDIINVNNPEMKSRSIQESCTNDE